MKPKYLDVVEAASELVAAAVGQGGWESICERVATTRTVRVFLSSVFDGLEGEREGLLEQHAPALQGLCIDNNVSLHFVDMRWGITNTDGSNNLTVVNCLRACDESDIFIGYWAQRYGWCGQSLHQSIDEAQKQGYSWLADYRDRSVTEIEFQCGFLREGASRASAKVGDGPGVSLFFRRSPEYDDEQLDSARPDEQRKWRTEEGCEAALKRQYDTVAERAQKAFYDGYTDPQEGAALQAECIHQLLVRLFSSKPMRGNYEPGRRAQDSFRTARDRLHIPNLHIRAVAKKYCERARHNNTTPLVITGAPGSGKSSAVIDLIRTLQADYGAVCEERASPHGAFWNKNTSARLTTQQQAEVDAAKLQQSSEPDTRPIYVSYFIGCSRVSTNFDEMTWQVARKLLTAKLLAEGESTDFDDARWRHPLSTQLSQVPAEKRISFMIDQLAERKAPCDRLLVLVLDGVNQLQNVSESAAGTLGSHDLSWLPETFPPSVACIISSLGHEPGMYESGQCLQVLKYRGCEILTIPPLDLSQRRELFERTLSSWGKGYSENQMFPCWNADASRNAMYMTLLLGELLAHGRWATLSALVERLVGFVRACKEVLLTGNTTGWEQADSEEEFVLESLAGGRKRLLPPLDGGCERTLSVWREKRLEMSPYELNPGEEEWMYPIDIPALQAFYQEHFSDVNAKMGTSVPELIGLIIDRLENSFPDDLVRDMLLCILASREGLYEYEVVRLLASDRNTISRLKGAVRHLIIDRGGILIFVHDFVRRAVQIRYVEGTRDVIAQTHAKMAHFFYSQTASEMNCADGKQSRQAEMFAHHSALSGMDPSTFSRSEKPTDNIPWRLNFANPNTSTGSPSNIALLPGSSWELVTTMPISGGIFFTGLTWANGVLVCATSERCYCILVTTPSRDSEMTTRIIQANGTACVSPNGSYVVAMQDDRQTLGVYEISSAAMVSSIDVGDVFLVTMSLDGNLIAVFGAESTTRSPGVRVYDTQRSSEVCCVWTAAAIGSEGFCQSLGGVAFSPDSKYVLAGCLAQGVAVFYASTGEEVCRVADPVEGNPGVVACVAWAPSGKYISVTWGCLKTVDIYSFIDPFDFSLGTVLHRRLGPVHPMFATHVANARFSPDGRHLASGSQKGDLKVWNVEDGELVADFIPETPEPENEVNNWLKQIAWAPDGRSIVVERNSTLHFYRVTE